MKSIVITIAAISGAAVLSFAAMPATAQSSKPEQCAVKTFNALTFAISQGKKGGVNRAAITAANYLYASARQLRVQKKLALCEDALENGVSLMKTAQRIQNAARASKPVATHKPIRPTGKPGAPLRWVTTVPGKIPAGALPGGDERGKRLYICRANHKNGLHPGKLYRSKCNIGWGGKEVPVAKYRVLSGDPKLISWVSVRGGILPGNALAGGRERGKPLYVCRARHKQGVHPGKVYRGKCYIGWGGKEVPIAAFQVLTKKGTASNPGTLVAGVTPIKRGKIVAKGAEIKHGQVFGYSFWIRPQKAEATWTSVMHKGSNNRERGPAVFMYPKSTRLHVRTSTNKSWNDGCDAKTQLALNKWSHVYVQFAPGTAWVYINGKGSSRCKIGNKLTLNKGDLYLGSPWFQAANANIRSLRNHNGRLTIQQIRQVMTNRR